MKNEKLISIIVPIYNVERYVKKCLDSIVVQTYNNLEIILVDDGSTDNSPSICDEYAARDSRISVIHKPNGGLSSARNAALDVFKGEYVTFIDGDDVVGKRYVEALFELVEKFSVELSQVMFRSVSEKESEIAPEGSADSRLYTQKEALRDMMGQQHITNSACYKLYARHLFDDIRYPLNVYFEDVAVTYKIIFMVDRVAYSSEVLYDYIKRESSITRSKFSTKAMACIYYAEEMITAILKKYPDLYRECYARLCNAAFGVIHDIGDDKAEFCKEFDTAMNIIKKYRIYSALYGKSRRMLFYSVMSYIPYFGVKIIQRV